MKKLLTLLGICLALVLLLSACATPVAPTPVTPTPVASPEVIKWTMQSWDPETPVFGHFYPYVLTNVVGRGWADWVEEVSNGRLEINYMAPGSCYPPNEALINIGKGTIQCSFTSSGYAGGLMPETYIAGNMPFTWTTAALGYDAYYQLGIYDIMEEAYGEHNVIHIPTLEQFPLNMATMFECQSPKDIIGRKIRIYGAQAKYIEAIGGLPVSMAYADVYMGLKLGTVEGATLGSHALEDIKLKEVIKGYVISPTSINPCDAILMNKDAFEELPIDLQKTILRDSKYFFAAASFMTELTMQWICADAQKNYGVELYTWSAEDTKWVREVCREKVWPELASANPRCQRMVEIIENQLVEYGLLD